VKLFRILFLLAIFLTSLYIGFQAGFFTAPDSQAAIASQASAPLTSAAGQAGIIPPTQPAPPASQPAGQRSILVIGVDNLSAEQPRLESIWLVLFVPPEPRLTYLPVFPSFSGSVREDVNLQTAFQYRSGKQPGLNVEFVQALQAKKLWWTGSLIVDRYAFAQVLDYLNADSTGDQTIAYLDGENWVKKMAEAAGKPQMAVANQANLYQELCWRAARQNWSLSALVQQEVSGRVAGHTQIDFDLAQSLQDTGLLNNTGSLYCDFPTLSGKTQIIQ
jgi:hypothetical protein